LYGLSPVRNENAKMTGALPGKVLQGAGYEPQEARSQEYCGTIQLERRQEAKAQELTAEN
jgi:Fe-S oxidoreductase